MRYSPKPIHWIILVVVLVTSIALCGCSSYGPSSTPTTTPIQLPEGSTVTIQNFAFTPASVTIPKGTTVTWVNQDTTNHQILNDATGTIGQGALFSSNSLTKGTGYSFKFDNPGTYPYHCSIHPQMKGTVIVT
jgi:plastocyanin